MRWRSIREPPARVIELNLPTIFLQTECPEMKMSLHLYHLSAWQFSLVWFNLIIWLIFQIISKCHYTFNIDKSLKFCFGNWPLGGQLISYYTKSTVIYGLFRNKEHKWKYCQQEDIIMLNVICKYLIFKRYSFNSLKKKTLLKRDLSLLVLITWFRIKSLRG